MFYSLHLQSSVTQEKHKFQSNKIIYNVLQSSVTQKKNIHFNIKILSTMFYNVQSTSSVIQEKHKFQSRIIKKYSRADLPKQTISFQIF